jgi:hypothetical protein
MTVQLSLFNYSNYWIYSSNKRVAGEVSGAKPDGCAKEQPLKKHGATDLILLECSGT